MAERTVAVEFEVSMSGVSEAVAADYPELLAAVAPSADELERYQPGGHIAVTVKPKDGRDVDVPTLSSVFGFDDGILFPDGVYVVGYVPIFESTSACRALGEKRDE